MARKSGRPSHIFSRFWDPDFSEDVCKQSYSQICCFQAPVDRGLKSTKKQAKSNDSIRSSLGRRSVGRSVVALPADTPARPAARRPPPLVLQQCDTHEGKQNGRPTPPPGRRPAGPPSPPTARPAGGPPAAPAARPAARCQGKALCKILKHLITASEFPGVAGVNRNTHVLCGRLLEF